MQKPSWNSPSPSPRRSSETRGVCERRRWTSGLGIVVLDQVLLVAGEADRGAIESFMIKRGRRVFKVRKPLPATVRGDQPNPVGRMDAPRYELFSKWLSDL